MKCCSNKTDAITDLHERGFTDDFKLVGNDLLWLHKGELVRVGEFAITEYHKLEKSIVFGIVALHHNIKGILLSHSMAPVLVKKLSEFNVIQMN